MRLRKDNDLMQEDEIILVAQVSDALAHPAQNKNIPVHNAVQ